MVFKEDFRIVDGSVDQRGPSIGQQYVQLMTQFIFDTFSIDRSCETQQSAHRFPGGRHEQTNKTKEKEK